MTLIQKLRRVIIKFRSAITGRYVTRQYAEKHPDITTRETDR